MFLHNFLLITFFYSAGIIDKSRIQFENLREHRTIYPLPLGLDIKKVGELTNNNDKVYFTGPDDFYYYYYGHYVPEGRYSPYLSWVYKSDMADFMQDLLDREYYIVSPGRGVPEGSHPDDEVLSELSYNKSVKQGGFKVIWKEK